MGGMSHYVNGLHFSNLRGDLFGGLTAAVVALPLAMAFGVASGVGPIAGMYGAIFVGLFAALFGGSPAQISGPTGPMTVVMAAVFVQYTGMFPEDPGKGMALAFTVVVIGGLFQIVFGLLKVGRFIELVPYPVISGFMSGIGVIIILLQIGPLLGAEAVSQPLLAAQSIPSYFSNFDPASTILAGLTLVLVYGVSLFLPRVNRMFPSPLMAMIVGTFAYLFFFQNDPGVQIIGEIPSGFPDIQFPTIELVLLTQMILSGLTLAALGAIDSLLTSLVVDNITRTQHKSNRELIGQGIGNAIAGIFGGMPGAGATMRTVVNVKAGGRTPLSGVIHALILLAIVLGAGHHASVIPKAVLAGILFKVGTDIVDWGYLKQLRKVPHAGLVMMLTVLLMTVFFDLIQAVAFGMVMASFVFVQRMVKLQLNSIQIYRNVEEANGNLSPEAAELLRQANGRMLVYHVGGPISFGAARGMLRKLSDHKDYDVLVIDLHMVSQMDYTSVRALSDLIQDVQLAGRKVVLINPPPTAYGLLNKQGVLQRVAFEHAHSDQISAFRDAYKLLQTHY